MTRISVIIPTYNGAHKIKGILDSLLIQSVKPDEVLVVVDGSADDTQNIVNGYASRMPQIKQLYQENRGRAAVRNMGAAHATGDLFLFFDDDIRLNPDTIERHLGFYKDNPDSLHVGPALLDPQKVAGDHFLTYRNTLENKWIENYPSSPIRVTFSRYAFTTANLSIPAAVFFRLGKFDERLSDGEDFELSLRALVSDVPVYFDKTNFVWHDDYISIEKYIKRQKQYINSKFYIQTIYPEYSRLAPHLFAYGSKPGIFGRIVYSLMTYDSMGKLLLAFLRGVGLNSQKMDRIYDVVIHASVLRILKQK